MFDHPRRGQASSSHLLSLSQGRRTVADYSISFRVAAAESGWGQKELLAVFLRGLSKKLKDELASWEEPDTLEAAISLAIRLDNRLRERERETRHPLPCALPPSSPPSVPPLASGSSNSTSSPEEPMQLGCARLLPCERRRYVEQRLCIYCGQSGHFLAASRGTSWPPAPRREKEGLPCPSPGLLLSPVGRSS